MIALKRVAMLAAGMGLMVSAVAQADHNSSHSIADRVKPAYSVCLEGEECASQVAAAPAAASGPRSGADVYAASCQACHAVGVAGAPKFGTSDWTERAAKGMDTLLANAINGINAMPPRGTCATCSDEEIQASIQHMLDSAP
ncbi:c-type cytochrome [Balneatrix alpica]|uniref:C-type cytochrome n=1 Tax=Balneatrix alpica TaxID=75684 RepID=A0ABV5ZGZ5_9GAMM